MIDHKDPSFMYTITEIGEDENGTKYIKSIVKYTSNVGYTGEAITNRSQLVYIPPDPRLKSTEIAKTEYEFKPEIDNYVCESIVTSAMFGPIIDTQGIVQGAIQILNKTNDAETFNETYTDEFESICDVIGSVVSNAHCTVNIMSLSHKMGQVLNNVSPLPIPRSFRWLTS